MGDKLDLSGRWEALRNAALAVLVAMFLVPYMLIERERGKAWKYAIAPFKFLWQAITGRID